MGIQYLSLISSSYWLRLAIRTAMSWTFVAALPRPSQRAFSTTALALAKKGAGKSKGNVTLVNLQSTVSNYTMMGRRPRLGEKMETLGFDPLVRKEVLFRENKKIKTPNIDGKSAFW